MGMRVQFDLTDEEEEVLKDLKKSLGFRSWTELYREAAIVLSWAASETGQGREMCSQDPHHNHQIRIFSTPGLHRLAHATKRREKEDSS